jgi:hypothetical protein
MPPANKHITLRIISDGADPDSLLLNFPGLDGQGVDYKALGFPRQGLANYLGRSGILKHSGSFAKGHDRGLWQIGGYFSRWARHYLENRDHYRSSYSLPSRELSGEVLEGISFRINAEAGYVGRGGNQHFERFSVPVSAV